MSFSSQEEVDCPCGETFEAPLWNSINLKEDPDLRSILMGGELNVTACSMCKSLVFTDRFVLVHDPDTQLLAFVHPKAREGEREFLETAMRKDTLEAQNMGQGMKISYPPVLLFGLENLVDLMRLEEEAADQSAILDALSASLPIRLVKLSPSAARTVGLPLRTPLGDGASPAEKLKAGVKAVLAANDRLDVYAGLLARAEKGELSAEAWKALA